MKRRNETADTRKSQRIAGKVTVWGASGFSLSVTLCLCEQLSLCGTKEGLW